MFKILSFQHVTNITIINFYTFLCTKSWKSTEYFTLTAHLNSDKVISQVLNNLWLVATVLGSTAVDDVPSL